MIRVAVGMSEVKWTTSFLHGALKILTYDDRDDSQSRGGLIEVVTSCKSLFCWDTAGTEGQRLENELSPLVCFVSRFYAAGNPDDEQGHRTAKSGSMTFLQWVVALIIPESTRCLVSNPSQYSMLGTAILPALMSAMIGSEMSIPRHDAPWAGSWSLWKTRCIQFPEQPTSSDRRAIVVATNSLLYSSDLAATCKGAAK
jgi:hypothetical protein